MQHYCEIERPNILSRLPLLCQSCGVGEEVRDMEGCEGGDEGNGVGVGEEVRDMEW